MRICAMNVHGIRQLPGVAAAVLLAAGLVAGPVQAQQGTIAGRITDNSNQQAVACAEVLVVGTSLPTRSARAGPHTFSKLPTGHYSVQVPLICYAKATSCVSVTLVWSATPDSLLTPV